MKKICQKITVFISRTINTIQSKERLATFICIPVAAVSILICVLLIGARSSEKKDENDYLSGIPEESETYRESPLSSTDPESLEYQSLGDGTCIVSGIGGYRGSELDIPAKNPQKETVIGISSRAFEGCGKLVSINIPETVVTIGNSVFKDCTSLVIISVDSKNPKYSSSGGTLFSKDKTRLICCPAARIGSNYLLNPNVKIIEENAFYGVKNITKILYEKSAHDFDQIHIYSGNDKFRLMPITCNYTPTK